MEEAGGEQSDEEDALEQNESDFNTYTEEQSFDFKSFIPRFAVKPVCEALALLFKDCETNSDFTNHCIVKLFHR